MVIYANEFETKEKQKLPEIKNELQHLHDISPWMTRAIKAHNTVKSSTFILSV